MAELTGKEAALMVPSGTMGNLISVMAHCWGRGAEVLLGDRSHIHIYEQGGVAQLGGVHPRSLTNLDDGTFSLTELEGKVREDDPHLPVTQLVAIENTHNKCGGVCLPLDWLEEVGKTCKRLGLPLHCDGARLLNAAVSQGVEVKLLLKHCDSASICLSKVATCSSPDRPPRSAGPGLPGGVGHCGVEGPDPESRQTEEGAGRRHETGGSSGRRWTLRSGS